MSFFTKHGNVKFVGDWMVDSTEYSLLDRVKPLLDAGPFSVSVSGSDGTASSAVTLEAGDGIILSMDTASNTITISANTTGLSLTDGTETIQVSTLVLGDGLGLESDGEGRATISYNRRDAEEFTEDDLKDDILTIKDCMLGDFVIADSDGVQVYPTFIQNGDDVDVDFADWKIEGTWRVIFR